MSTEARRARLELVTGRGEIVVDGHPIPGVVAVKVTTSVDDLIPRMELDLRLHRIEVDGEIEVSVPEATRDALIALGWTPPTGAGPVTPRTGPAPSTNP